MATVTRQLRDTTRPTRPVDLAAAFVSHVDRQPDAPALVWRDEEISYQRLHELATRAQAFLEALGTPDGQPIGIVAKKSPEAIALILGCFLAHQPFLLPPPSLPRQALQTAFQQAGCRRMVSVDPHSADVPWTSPLVAPSAAGVGPTTCPLPAGVAFLLTTSGSTGVPKIVPLDRDGVNRFTDWVTGEFGVGAGKTSLNYAPLNFVVSLLDLWATLKSGGRVVLVDTDLATSPAYLVDLLLRHEVHLVQAVPMFYRLLIDGTRDHRPSFDDVEHVISTGDSMPPDRLPAIRELFRRARFHNGYGCTETLTSFFHELRSDTARSPIPLGRPLPGVHVLVVDDAGEVLTRPGIGELYVSTPFQAHGYLDPDLNAGKFVAHPQGRDQVRYFRTGDLVRCAEDGTLTLVGRNDFEVKVRGVRVNAQEVEQALLEKDDVVEAAVVALAHPVAGRILHSVVRRARGSGLNSLTLRQHCALRLPPAAIPSSIHFVDEPLPKTASGKLDRRAVERALTNSSRRPR